MGAALAYYTAFSVAPLLIISIAVAGLFFGRDAAQEAIVAQIGSLLGDAGGDAIDDILRSNSDFGTGVLSLAVGIGALILGATTAFVELQDDLDRIWKAPPRVGSGIVNFIRARMLSFGMVLFIGFLLAVSLALNAAIAAMGRAMFAEIEVLLQVATLAVTFAVTTTLFAMIYKVLPNTKTAWAEIWWGAAVTAVLFESGKVSDRSIHRKELGRHRFRRCRPFRHPDALDLLLDAGIPVRGRGHGRSCRASEEGPVAHAIASNVPAPFDAGRGAPHRKVPVRVIQA